MKYLFIVTEFESANGICVQAVMECLSKKHQVYCITNREWGMPEEFVKDKVICKTVKPRLTYRINSAIRKSTAPVRVKSILRKVAHIMERIKLLMFLPFWPWISPLYTRRIGHIAKNLCSKENIQCIVPVYTQIDTLIVANKIKKHNADMLYVPYFLDSLSGGYGLRVFSGEQTIKKGLEWEHKLLDNADEIIAMESSREHHKRFSRNASYYNRIRYFDLPLLYQRTIESDNLLMSKECCNLVYVGTLPQGIRSPLFLLSTLTLIPGENFRFYFIGTKTCIQLNDAAARDSRIKVIGQVNHDVALKYIAQSDIVMNIGSSNPNMTPSKIFEYMSFGKPIISTAPIQNEPSKLYLKKYPMALVIDESAVEINQAAMMMLSFIKDYAGLSVELNSIKDKFFYNTPDSVAAFLDKITGLNIIC